jgi:hypothetical protein
MVRTVFTQGRLPRGYGPVIASVLAAFILSAKGGGHYQDLATQRLVNRAREISEALTKAGFLPAESFTNPTVLLEGQSAHPSGQVFFGRCEYEFREGLPSTIRRQDLFEDKGPESLILTHLTNTVLTLSTNSAPEHAQKLLRLLGYDVNRMREVFSFKPHDDLMTGYPIRRAGPDFPKDLHFFGELISREKIKIMVNFRPADESAVKDRFLAEGRVEFLATTGELLEAWWLPGSDLCLQLGIAAPKQIVVEDADDLKPPFFVSVTNRSEHGENIGSDEVLTLVREAWRDLSVKLGTNKPGCILVCDNLNRPASIAHEVAALAGEIPWAGISHWFRLDLPFEPTKILELAKGKRGLSLLAIGGTVETRLEIVPGLDETPRREEDLNTPAGQEAWKAFHSLQKEALQDRVESLWTRLDVDHGGPDNVLFIMSPRSTYPASVLIESLESRLRGKGQLEAMFGTGRYPPAGDGITYFNGTLHTNTAAVLRLAGFLPLAPNHYGMLQRAAALGTNLPANYAQRMAALRSPTEIRLVSGAVLLPMRELASSFGPHPLEDVVSVLGEPGIEILRNAERVEIFRIKSNRADDLSTPGRPAIEGYEILAQTEQGREFATKVSGALVSERNQFGIGKGCGFSPGVAFRIWKGKESGVVIVCFQCNDLALTFYDSSGSEIKRTSFDFVLNRSLLLGLARRALPSDSVLSQLDSPKKQPDVGPE